MAAALHARAQAIERLAALMLRHGDTEVAALPSGRASASPRRTSSENYGDSERTLAATLLQQQQQSCCSAGADTTADAPWQHRTRSAYLSALPPAAHSQRPAVQQPRAKPASKAHPLHCDVPDCKHCQYEARWRQVREGEGGERPVELLGLLLGGGRTASSRAALAAGGRRLAWGRDSNSG